MTTPPLTGPAAIQHALSRINIDQLEAEQQAIIKARKVSKRPRAIDILNAIQGLRRNKLTPSDLMITSVPVIPPAFRPFSLIGDTFVPGDANELYRDLIKVRDAYATSQKTLGDAGSREAGLALYDSVKALYGYRDPVEPKTRQRGVSGFLKKVSGHSPKWSFFQRVLLSKPQDSVGRSVAGVDPDLGLDEIGLPTEMAWRMYSPYIQGRLVRSGMSPTDALKQLKDRTDTARRALEQEVATRPVVYSRAPAWHKFNTIAGWPKLHEGNAVMINPLVTTGMNADFDGDALNVHVPSMDDAVDEAKKVLMPSTMLFSEREAGKVVPVPKHEMIQGLFSAQHRPARKTHTFPDETSALAAIQRGEVALSDEVNIGKQLPPVKRSPVSTLAPRVA